MPEPPATKLTPRELEEHWYHNVYLGDQMKQLTLRAVLMGGALGSLMSLVNIYVGLKTDVMVEVTEETAAYILKSDRELAKQLAEECAELLLEFSGSTSNVYR